MLSTQPAEYLSTFLSLLSWKEQHKNKRYKTEWTKLINLYCFWGALNGFNDNVMWQTDLDLPALTSSSTSGSTWRPLNRAINVFNPVTSYPDKVQGRI